MATPARIAPKGAGKLASFASVRRGLSLIPFDKIGFVFHYFFSRFFFALFRVRPETDFGA